MEQSQPWSFISSEPRIYDAVRKRWNAPTPIQESMIPQALLGKNIMGKAPTGSGKTLAYIIPVLIGLLHTPESRALVLVPTRELCKQVSSQFLELSKDCHLSVAHLGSEISTKAQLAALVANPPNVLIGTPSRVNALISPDSSVSLETFFQHVAYFIVDEADQQLLFSPRTEIESILTAVNQPQTFLMSATLSPEVEDLKTLILQNPIEINIEELSRASILTHYFLKVESKLRFEVLYLIIKINRLGHRLLLFSNTSHTAYKLKLFLERFSIKCAVLDAKLPVASRVDILQSFNISKIDILIAIDEKEDVSVTEFSAARGIDFQKLDAVINFDIPTTVESYIHRVGRTARAMEHGIALTFLSDETSFQKIAEYLNEQGTPAEPLDVNPNDAISLRYRVDCVLGGITKNDIIQASKASLNRELLYSEKLKQHFMENPADLQFLKHDSSLIPTKVSQSLSVIPDYLGVRIKKLQDPLTQKAKKESKISRKQLANLDGLNAAIKKARKQKDRQNRGNKKKSGNW